MSDVRSTLDNKTIKSGYNPESTTSMPKVLQKDERAIGATSPPVRTTELILDNAYILKAAEFVKDAKSEVVLCAYAWRWYQNEPEIGIQKFNIELLRAHGRGVRVCCLVNNYTMFKYFTTLGFKVKYVDRTRMLHTKAIAIDQKTLVLGSHNLTKRANSDNFEASIATQDFEVVAQFVEYFNRMWAVANES